MGETGTLLPKGGVSLGEKRGAESVREGRIRTGAVFPVGLFIGLVDRKKRGGGDEGRKSGGEGKRGEAAENVRWRKEGRKEGLVGRLDFWFCLERWEIEGKKREGEETLKSREVSKKRKEKKRKEKRKKKKKTKTKKEVFLSSGWLFDFLIF